MMGRYSGTAGAGLLNLSESASKRLIGVGAALTVADAVVNGRWQGHNTANLAITAGIYLVADAIPVAGWIFAGAYFVGDMATHYYTGKSITEIVFDVQSDKINSH